MFIKYIDIGLKHVNRPTYTIYIYKNFLHSRVVPHFLENCRVTLYAVSFNAFINTTSRVQKMTLGLVDSFLHVVVDIITTTCLILT